MAQYPYAGNMIQQNPKLANWQVIVNTFILSHPWHFLFFHTLTPPRLIHILISQSPQAPGLPPTSHILYHFWQSFAYSLVTVPCAGLFCVIKFHLIANKRSAGVTPEVNLRSPLLADNEAHTTEGSIFALKSWVDITRMPKYGYQWPHKKFLCPPRNIKQRKIKDWCQWHPKIVFVLEL